MRRLSKNFFLITDSSGNDVIISGKLQIAARIRKNGYIPKSGLLLAEQLIRMKIRGKTLDIGTGETGILANCLSALGASYVIATDIDPLATDWACRASNRSGNIAWVNCDLFPSGLPNESFGMIVSNPPQMPMPNPGHPHDYGGPDGRDHIFRVIRTGSRLLCKDGKLLLLCFDFLGVQDDFGHGSIVNIAQSYDLETRIVARHQKRIRSDGRTKENIGWIETVYPEYTFKRDAQGHLFHEIFILEMKHREIKN